MAFAVITPIILICVIAIPVLIGVYIYRDADRRGMNAALWTIVAIFTPGFIGLIIYLIVRSEYADLLCPNCGAPVTEQFAVCPNCGTRLKSACPQCQMPVEAEWTVCPRCASPLLENREDVKSPVKRKDKSLFKLLLIIVIVPLVILVILAAATFVSYVDTGSARTSVLTAGFAVDEFKDDYNIKNWMQQCDKEPGNVYAMRYCINDNNTAFLIYYPKGIDSFSAETERFWKNKVEVSIASNGDTEEAQLIYVEVSSAKDGYGEVDIEVNDDDVPCQILDVDYDPISIVR